MSTLPPKLQKMKVDKDKFDAVLHRMIASKPMPLKEMVGKPAPRQPKQGKAVQKLD